MAMSDEQCCYLCNECPNKSFVSLDDLESHMSVDHDQRSPADVDVVDDSSSSGLSPQGSDMSEAVPRPTRGSHPSMDDTMVEAQNSPSSSTSGSVQQYLHSDAVSIQQDGTKTYPCRLCAKMFGDRDQLNVHYTHTHRDKPQYVCELCNAVFNVKRELSTHMRLHSGEQPHKCPECGKEFGTRQLLKKHLMWHTGERSHVCAICSKSFFQKGHLTQHMQIHSGERPHRCHLCKKTFIFTFDLNRHMKIHLERRFSCEACQKSFSEQKQLDEHCHRCKGTPDRKRSAPSRDSDVHSLSSDESRPSTDGSGAKMARMNAPKEQGVRDMHSPAQAFSAFRQHLSPASSSSIAQAPQFAEHPTDSSRLMLAGAQRLMANAALQNFGALANGSPLMANLSAMVAQLHATRLLASGQAPPQLTSCSICMKQFESPAALFVHWNSVHVHQANLTGSQGNQVYNNTSLMKAADEHEFDEPLNLRSDSTTISSCASSPQKVSPLSSSSISPASIDGQLLANAPYSHAIMTPKAEPTPTAVDHECAKCDCYRQRNVTLEKALSDKCEEVARMKELIQRVLLNANTGKMAVADNFLAFKAP